jgi:hypothetical protein
MPPIYLDYNASTPVDPAVAATMRPLLEEVSLSQIKSGHIDDGDRRGSGDRQYYRPARHGEDRGILVQRQVSARAVVVAHVREQHVTQMAFAEYNDMINAFPADRSDQPFGVCVLPR